MNSNSTADKSNLTYTVKSNLLAFWAKLSQNQQSFLKKIWSILTYKWKWQLILNTPFLVLWILDQTIPEVHSFDMQLITSLPIPMTIKTLLGFST
tara:strand:+ start:217 stop:501 length:285 start_codon:yes stop_codon:yes gene_type:complete